MEKSLRKLFLLLLLFFGVLGVNATPQDSTHFVTASLLTMGPGAEVYSVFGHNALRMQCPSKGLDYCFTFEMEDGLSGYLKFFAGKAKATFVAVPTAQFLSTYLQEGRSVKQDEINLTPHEKQELWRALDEDMMLGPYRQFNLLQNNCTSSSMLMIESVMMNEEIDYGQMPAPMYYNNGNGIRYLSRKSPWAQFLFMSFVGTEADVDWSTEQKLSPEMCADVLRHATIVNHLTGTRRPAIIGKQKILHGQTTIHRPSPVTPTILFSALLALIIIITAAELLETRRTTSSTIPTASTTPPAPTGATNEVGRWARVGKATDIVLFTAQTLCGIVLLFITLLSGLFGMHFNWLLIPFNPLPFLLWLLFRKKSHSTWCKVYLFYTAVLTAFLLITPFITTQLLLPHYLAIATLLVRTAQKM